MLNFYQSRDLVIDSVTLPATNKLPLPDANGRAVAEDITVNERPPAVSFIARSGTGKTTLVTSLIAELKNRGYAVGAVKHGPPNFEIDHPGICWSAPTTNRHSSSNTGNHRRSKNY